VLHSIFEKHEVHDGVQLVVFTESKVALIREFISIGELIVNLVVERLYEVSEYERLRRRSEIFGQVELVEALLAKVADDRTVIGQVSWAYEPITVNTFALVHPQLD
jgi:hypothetical protein